MTDRPGASMEDLPERLEDARDDGDEFDGTMQRAAAVYLAGIGLGVVGALGGGYLAWVLASPAIGMWALLVALAVAAGAFYVIEAAAVLIFMARGGLP